jgi:hypothetical protein
MTTFIKGQAQDLRLRTTRLCVKIITTPQTWRAIDAPRHAKCQAAPVALGVAGSAPHSVQLPS